MNLEILRQNISSIRDSFPEHWVVSPRVEINSHPFSHVVIDNFFTGDEFKEIQQHETKVEGAEVQMLHSIIHKSGEIESEIFEDAFLKDINSKYFSALHNILGILAERKKDIYDFTDFHLVSTGPDYGHKIHDDIPRKLLSVVIYINPENNNGTFIHKRKYDTNPVDEVEWKQNRAFVFSRLERKTWHSYCADKVNKRYCVVYNLNTEKVYKAHLAERNYLKYLKNRLRNN